eukprot:1134885-Prymnesium_polylepis.1
MCIRDRHRAAAAQPPTAPGLSRPCVPSPRRSQLQRVRATRRATQRASNKAHVRRPCRARRPLFRSLVPKFEFEPWRLERLAASGCIWQASGRRLDVWASERLRHGWFTSGHVWARLERLGLYHVRTASGHVWARLGTSGHVWARLG